MFDVLKQSALPQPFQSFQAGSRLGNRRFIRKKKWNRNNSRNGLYVILCQMRPILHQQLFVDTSLSEGSPQELSYRVVYDNDIDDDSHV